MLFVLKSFINSLLYVKFNECRSTLRKLQHSNPYNSKHVCSGVHLSKKYRGQGQSGQERVWHF